jgi:hypothetical protein
MAVFKNNVPLITDGLVYYFDAGNINSVVSGSTTAIDLTRKNQNGVFTNVTSPGNGTLTFNNGYITVPTSSAELNSQQFSIVTIFRTSDYTTNQSLLEKGITQRTQFGFRLENRNITGYVNESGSLANTNVTNTHYINTAVYKKTKQIHSVYSMATYTYNSGSGLVKMYYGDKLTNSQAVNYKVNIAPDTFRIGSGLSIPFTFTGSFAAALLYNRELSSTEVRTLMNTIYPRYSAIPITPTASLVTTNLIMDLNINNPNSYSGTGSTWTDLQGNYNFTLYNSPSIVGVDGARCISFNGSNTYAFRTGSISHNIGSACTINMVVGDWVGGATTRAMSVCQNLINEDYINYFCIVVTGKTEGINTGIGNIAPAAADLTLPQYKILTYTWDTGSGGAFYVNSVKVNTANITGFTSANVQRMAFGTNAGTLAENGNVRIAEVKMYDRKLTDAEVVQNYDALKTTYGLT